MHLTKEDVDFMRRANHIQVHIDGKVATIDMEEDWSTVKRGVTLTARLDHSGMAKYARAYFSFSANGAWQVLALLARVGDELCLHVCEHATDDVRRAEDTLSVQLWRKGKILRNFILQSFPYDGLAIVVRASESLRGGTM